MGGNGMNSIIKEKLINLTYDVLRKWEKRDDSECPYCREFNSIGLDIEDPYVCVGCPIMTDTGSTLCLDTPYYFGGYQLEFDYLLNMAYSQGLESKYMEELDD
jgi:hypothetical protein